MRLKLLLFSCLMMFAALSSINLFAQSKGKIAWLGNNVRADSLYFETLTNAGYTVVDKTATKGDLTPDQITDLESFDLIILSRSLNSGDYKYPATYDKIQKPFLIMANMAARTTRLNMFPPPNTDDATTTVDVMRAMDLTHPIFNNLALTDSNTIDIATPGNIIKPLLKQKSAGLGKLIGATSKDSLLLIAEWKPKQPYFVGSPDTLHGKRMIYFNTQGSNGTGSGISFISKNGNKILLNIAEYLITGKVVINKGNIAWLGNNVRADSLYFVFLKDAGYNVVDKTATKGRLTKAQVSDLNSYDLVILSRSLNSGDYKYPAAYDSIQAPFLCMANMGARTTRMNWFAPPNTDDATTTVDVMSVLDTQHPVFNNLTLSELNTIDIATPGTIIKPLLKQKDAGLGKLIGITSKDSLLLMAEWDAKQPMFVGSPDTLHGKRMIFFNTQGSNGTGSPISFLSKNGKKLVTNVVEYMITGKVAVNKGNIAWLGNNVRADSLYFVNLKKAGYNVVDKTATKGRLNAGQIGMLNDFDLVILSRSLNSGDYKYPEAYDSIQAPFVCMANMGARTTRMNWFAPPFTDDATDIKDVVAVLEPKHPIFNNVTLTESNTIDIAAPNTIIKPLLKQKSAGNGNLIGVTSKDSLVMIAEWSPKQPYYSGSIDTLHGKRMIYFNTQGSNGTGLSESFLSPNGYLILNNIAEYMITGKVAKPEDAVKTEVAYICEKTNPKGDSLYVDLLKKNGCNVKVINDLVNKMPSDSAMKVLEASDVILISRNTNSAGYTYLPQYNSLATPILVMNAYIARSQRWQLLETATAMDNIADTVNVLVPEHPIFKGVKLNALNQLALTDTLKAGLCAIDSAKNATIIAKSPKEGYVAIAEWKKNTKFYDRTTASAYGHRMLFSLTNDFVITADAQKAFVNAVKYMAAFDYDTVLTNQAPTDILISKKVIAENSAIASTVGLLTPVDPNPGDSWIFSFAAGEGDTDNAKFAINVNKLVNAQLLDFETTPTLSVRISVADTAGLTFEKVFEISVTDVNEAPSEIVLSNSVIDENVPVATLVGKFTATDPDAGTTLSFSKVAGDGVNDADNDKFSISNGNSLKTKVLLDYETQSTYHINIQVSDGKLSSTQSFTITLNDLTVGIGSIENKDIQVYPNPFADVLYIKSMKNTDATVSLFDVNGKVVYQKQHSLDNELQLKLQMPAGVYILKVDGNKVHYMNRIVRQ
jgi:hypothetical protein